MSEKDWFEEFDKHLLEDKKPSDYFNDLLDNERFPTIEPYSVFIKLKDINQEAKHHPEGDVWNHTMEVIDLAAKHRHLSDDIKVFMWAAMLHDLGKIPTTKVRKGRITAYDHDKEGAVMARDFLEEVIDDNEFIEKVVGLVRWHMQPLFVYKNLPFAKVQQMVEETSLEEVGLLGVCDRMGRGALSDSKKKEVYEVIIGFLEKGQRKVAENKKQDVQNTINEIKKLENQIKE